MPPLICLFEIGIEYSRLFTLIVFNRERRQTRRIVTNFSEKLVNVLINRRYKPISDDFRLLTTSYEHLKVAI